MKEVALSKGVKDAADLARRTGLAYETAYRLWRGEIGNERRSIGIVTLGRVADALNVPVSELYEHVPTSR